MTTTQRVLAAAWLTMSFATPTADAADLPVGQRTLVRATVQSTFEEDGGARLYVRLKLQALAHAPFSTVTYRVPDRAMLAQLRKARRVEFSAARIARDNTVTHVRVLEP